MLFNFFFFCYFILVFFIIIAYQGRRQDFMEGFLKRCVLCAHEQNFQSHIHFDHTFQLLRTSNDLPTGLRRKRSKNKVNSAILWFMNKENDGVRPHLFV